MISPTKLELEAKLARYRDLAHEFFDPVSTENLRKATEELEQQISEFKE